MAVGRFLAGCMHTATFTRRTRLLAVLLVAVSAVIMGCSVDVCHGAREGTFSRPDETEQPAAGYGRGMDPSYDDPLPGRHVCIKDRPCGGLTPYPFPRPRPYPFPRPRPYHHTPPPPSSSPPAPPQNGEIPPP